MTDMPLVSILIPNYNYGPYLRNCLDSVLNQNYPNIEVIFRDNNSTDNSFEIAMEYYEKFRQKGIYFSIHRNRYNFGSDKNSNYCVDDSHGEILYTLGSDDSIEPTFIDKCVQILTEYPNVSMVMTHRKEMDENGVITESEPFYNTNCIIRGEDQAAVFMMAGIAIPTQRICRKECLSMTRRFARIWNVAGDWYVNYRMSMVGDIAYLKEPLVCYRVHSGNETNESEKILLGVFEHYQLLNSFKEMALNFNMKKPVDRYPEAIKKLASMCLRYALKMYQNGLNDVAVKYLKLAPVFDPEIEKNQVYIRLMELSLLNQRDFEKSLAELKNNESMKRTCSYNPPDGYIQLEL